MRDSDPTPRTEASETPQDLSRSVELVRAAQDGDRQALNELFRRYHERVHRIARIRMGARVRSFMDSVDLVQNTYVVAMRRIHDLELRNPASIIQWLSRILENQIRDAADYAGAGKRNRDREVPLEDSFPDESGGGARVEGTAPRPLQEVERRELQEIFDECVQRLDDAHREVILLRDYAGGTWEYVARELGRPSVHAAQELHRRARAKLARLLTERVDFDA